MEPKSLVNLLIIKLLSIAILCGTVSIAYGSELRMQVLTPMQRVFYSTPVVEENDAKIELWTARNEYASTQVAVYSEEEVIIDKVQSTDLVNEANGKVLAASNFSYRFPAYVFVERHTGQTPDTELDGKAPGWFPDPFEESQKLSFSGTRSLYGTWYVPPDTPPGHYRGELLITSGSGRRRLPVLLQVWNFTLPTRPSLYVTNWVYISTIESHYQVKRGTGEFWRVIEKVAQDLAAHRQSVIYTQLSLIRSTQMPDGSYKFDFRDYERWVNIFLNQGFQAFEGSHLFHGIVDSYNIQRFIGSGTVEFGDKQLATPEGQQYLLNLLQALHGENQKLGIQGKYLQHIRDEAGVKDIALYRQIAALVRTAMPGIPIIDATGLSEDKRAGMMDIPVTVMGKPVSELNEGVGIAGGQWGRWWYTATFPRGRFPNRFIDYPLVKLRLIPWLSWRTGMSGYLHYGYNCWDSPKKSPWEYVGRNGNNPPGDPLVVYPPRANRTGGPVSSLRWEAFRDGMQDYEYLNLLERWTNLTERSDKAADKKLREEATKLLQDIKAAVASPEEYPRDSRAVESLRRRMGEVLDKIASCTGGGLSKQ